MGDFREMHIISAILVVQKIDYGHVIYHFKAPDLGIKNISFVSNISRFYGQ